MEPFKAMVQYGDMKGEIKIDQGDIQGFIDFVKAQNIDTSQYFPIGVDFHLFGGEHPSINIITIDTMKHNIIWNFDNVKDFIERHEQVPVVIYEVSEGLDGFFKYTKRVNIVFETDGLSIYGKELDIEQRNEIKNT